MSRLSSYSNIYRRCRYHKRTLFTFPGVSSEPQRYQEHKIFPYTPKDLYEIVADVGSYPRFVPFCVGSRVLDSPLSSSKIEAASTPKPFIMEAELTVGFLHFKDSYVSQVRCTPYKSVEAVASSSTPLFKTLSTIWKFEPATPTSNSKFATLVTLDLAYAFSNPVYATVSSTFFGQVSKLMVKAFEQRCIDIYGHGDK